MAQRQFNKIPPSEIRAAIEKKMGMNYPTLLAETYSKLYDDFVMDKHVREFLHFQENMNRRILVDQPQQINLDNLAEPLTVDEARAVVSDYVKKISTYAADRPHSDKVNQPDTALEHRPKPDINALVEEYRRRKKLDQQSAHIERERRAQESTDENLDH